MTQTPNESGRVPAEPPTGRRGGGRGGATPSRVGSLWVASILFAVVLLLLLIFVLENGQSAKISYLGAHGSLPQGVALLLAAVFGILLVALPGTARIIQLRIRERRHRGTARIQPSAAPPATPAVDAGPAEVGGAGPVTGPVTAAPTPIEATPPSASASGSGPPATDAPAAPVATQSGSANQPPAQSPPADDRR
jgi:uncharacterized integral membrane protein